MIRTRTEYDRAEDEVRDLEARPARLRADHPIGEKGFTEAGVRKLIARLHEDLAVFERNAGMIDGR